VTNDISINYEPLPGYRLIERIGAGGYGEVWRAEAPGGLTKAIKLVFGTQHEKRATNELRALDHVRAVRHPFLLSLERIEVVDGRLLVVTELADGSLKDRFDECRRDGKPGIPRDELLSYMRDAADALDFMSSAHALQHLDIKPENLLLLAGHVKVADFGLVKDVRQSQASMVGGMTPLYAAPEVFRGCPSNRSDQYSLAIVYQEMLTGTLPFIGSNAAELTLHHLNNEPDLTPLSAGDRYCLSRALGKDPEHRYTSCRELIDSLFKLVPTGTFAEAPAPASKESFLSAETYVDPKVRETQEAAFFEEEQPADWNRAAQMLLELPESDCRLVDLPPVNLAGRDARPVPTLVIGIGGTAAHVLSQFRQSLGDQWGNAKEVPAIQFLQIDTDARGAQEAGRGEAHDLCGDEVLLLPLRRPQHYRENSQQLLHWLSRRWLYNIPRSLQTEGLRPLGRLALADQARQVGQRVRRAMVQALEPAALAKSSGTVGQGFRNDMLRVFVVASISGGTGSGMSIDIGYAVRAILQKLGVKHAQLVGLMLHSTGRDARHGELARVNAYSWLTEFKHYLDPASPYPGDISCGLPGHGPGVAAFDHTYLVQLGESLECAEFEQSTRAVADYIRLNALSTASAFFDACRPVAGGIGQQEAAATHGIRSFGIYRQTATSPELHDEFATLVSEQVLAIWNGTATNCDANAAETENRQLVQRLKLESAAIAANARKLIERELGADPAAFLADWLKRQAATAEQATECRLAVIDELFGQKQGGGESSREITFLGNTPAALVSPLAEKLREDTRRAMYSLIDEPRQRLHGARTSLAWVNEHLNRVESELQRIRGAVAERLTQIRSEAAMVAPAAIGSPVIAAENPGWVDEYFLMRLDQLTILAAEFVVGAVRADLKCLSDEFTSLGREIDQVASAIKRNGAARAAEADDSESDTAAKTKLANALRSRL
jgi:eukaryotic-like serine/threonine-protein kinase